MSMFCYWYFYLRELYWNQRQGFIYVRYGFSKLWKKNIAALISKWNWIHQRFVTVGSCTFWSLSERKRNQVRKWYAKLPTARPIWGETFSSSLRSFISRKGGMPRSFCLPDFLTTLPGSPYPLIRSFSSSHSTFRYFYHSFGDTVRRAAGAISTTCI